MKKAITFTNKTMFPKKLYLTFAAAVILFAGCTAEEGTPNVPSRTTTTTQTTIGTSNGQITVGEPEDKDAVPQPDSTVDQGAPAVAQPQEISIADRTALQSSLQLKDPAFCDKISSTEYKETCKTVVNDQIIMSAALKDLDATQCEKLSSKDIQDACKIQIEASKQLYGERQKQFESMEEKRKQEEELVKEIMASLDYDKCSQLTIGTNKEDCQFSVALNLAVKNKDISQCQKAPRDLVEPCESNYRSVVGE
jgi:hypothetical protein